MKHIGTLEMRFAEMCDGIAYYDVRIDVVGKQRKVVLPRHHRMLGWIEVFGLPPQHEWVVIVPTPDDVFPPFASRGVLTIDGERFSETLDFHTNRETKTHTIEITRAKESEEEQFVFTEDWSQAPDYIHAQGLFAHPEGEYHYRTGKHVYTETREALIHAPRAPFIKECVEQHGDPSVVVTKSFAAGGAPSPTMQRMFTVSAFFDPASVSGDVCEVGYLRQSGDSLDRAHGDWYKLFTVNDEQFYIAEDNYSSREVETKDGKMRIKDTYRKRLYRL